MLSLMFHGDFDAAVSIIQLEVIAGHMRLYGGGVRGAEPHETKKN